MWLAESQVYAPCFAIAPLWAGDLLHQKEMEQQQ